MKRDPDHCYHWYVEAYCCWCLKEHPDGLLDVCTRTGGTLECTVDDNEGRGG